MDIVFNPNINRMTNMQLCRLYMDEFVKSKERKWMLDKIIIPFFQLLLNLLRCHGICVNG